MGFNQVENGLLARAIAQLKPLWEAVYGPYQGQFYLGNGIRFMVLDGDGPNHGKLTVAKKDLEGRMIPDPDITPVDCYNLVRPGEDIATAVARIIHNRDTLIHILVVMATIAI